jgi:hypothetical protein
MAKAIGGGVLQSVADWNMALDKGGNLAAVVENVLIKTGAIDGNYKRMPMVEAALQAPASAKAGIQGTALNTTETVLALNNLAMGKPRYRVQETGEFVYSPLGGVAPLTQMAGEGKTLAPVTDADLDEHRYQLYAKENAIRSTYLDIMDEKLLGVKPNQSFTLPAEILLAPENLAPGFAATRVTGAARLGKLFSAKTLGAAEAAAGGSANIIDKGADVFTRAVQRMTFGALDRKTQSKIAKTAAYGGGAGAVATVMSGAPEEARNTALALMSLYPMYKMGSGVLRRVEGATGTAKMIMRESADATNGMDDVARAAVANNSAVPREIREALVNPSKFVPLESTPARIAKNEAFSPRVRQVAARLANPLIVQASRTAGAVGRGAVVGPLVNIPFAEAYREMGDEQTAEGIYGAGVLFGAGGGLVGRVAGARGRRRDAAVSDIGRMLVDIQQNNAGELGRAAPDRAAEVYYSMKEPGRMLTDVELAGGDIDALMRNTKFEDLAGMAAMQGFYRDSVDFIPLNGLDYDANVSALGGNGTAGYFLHAPEGQRARLFLNADARRTDVAPHEYGHALLASAAISPEMKNSARASVNQRYGPEKLDSMAREYARTFVANRNAREFPGQKIEVSETDVDSVLNELSEGALARGDSDRLDWLRDEVFAEEHRAAGIDYAQIRRGIPAGFNPVGFAENVLGANARALAAAGAPIDPQTGKLQAPPDRLFKDNPILAADPVMRRNIRQYISAYQQWLNDPAHEAPSGAPLTRAGNPNDLKNNPNVTFRDYGNGRLENELAFIDESGNVKLRDKKNDPDRAKFIRARQQQVREMIDRGTKEPNDPTFGVRFRDGQRIVAGKTLPPRFDLTRFPAPLKQLARRMEALGTAGETMQVRYFALGKSKDVFKQGDLRNAQAINREVMFVEWQATKDGNINAFVVDLTQFRNRAMKAIAQRDPSLAEINWDFKQLEADLRRVLDNHANGRAGADGIGDTRRNAVNALLGIGTKTNRAANPLTGLSGKGSALKTLRLDAFDDIAGTGRQGFSFDYQKANGNFMPDAPAPRPDLDTDLPVRMPQQIPREAQGMPDAVDALTTDQLQRQYEENQGYLGLSTLGMREGRPVRGGAAQTRELLRRNEAISAELERRGVRSEDPQLQRALQRRGQAMPDTSGIDETKHIIAYRGGPSGAGDFPGTFVSTSAEAAGQYGEVSAVGVPRGLKVLSIEDSEAMQLAKRFARKHPDEAAALNNDVLAGEEPTDLFMFPTKKWTAMLKSEGYQATKMGEDLFVFDGIKLQKPSAAPRGQAMPDAVHGDNTPLPPQVPDRGFYVIGTKPTADGRVLEYHLDPATTIQPRVADIESIRGEQVAMLEADRHNTRGDNMGGPLHPFLISNQTIARLLDGRGFKAVWANMNSAFVTRAKNIVKNTTAGHALIQIMKENAHRSNRKFVMDVTSEIDARRANMTSEQADFLHVLLELGAINPQGRINQAYSRIKRASDAALEGEATMAEVAEAQRDYDQTFDKYQPMVEFLNRISPLKSHATRGRSKEFAGEFASVVSKHGSTPWYSSMASKYRNTKFVDEAARFSFKQRGAAMDRITGIPFAPDVKAMLKNSMDFVNGQNLDVVGVVQLSKDMDAFAVYFGKNPKEEAKMSANERMLRDQFLASGTFKAHPSYDWVMLGPENADSFILDAPADPLKLFPDYAKNHPNPKVKKGSKETVVGTMKKSKIPLVLK